MAKRPKPIIIYYFTYMILLFRANTNKTILIPTSIYRHRWMLLFPVDLMDRNGELFLYRPLSILKTKQMLKMKHVK